MIHTRNDDRIIPPVVCKSWRTNYPVDIKNISFEKLDSDLKSQFKAIASLQDLDLLKRDWLGKDGILKGLFKQMGALSQEEKPVIAQKLNQLKTNLEDFLLAKENELKSQSLKAALNNEFLDLSLPAPVVGRGRIHPVTEIERKVTQILKPFGFKVVHGPEIETNYYCFDSLNIPPHHPARDMQDTFFTTDGHLLRTHTTSVQARVLKAGGLPIKVCSPGRVYRNEKEDASHTAMFHQYELIWLEQGLTLANLMALMSHIAKGLYGKRRKVRFKPKFYPYTEPSLGLDIDCALCQGAGCSMCGGAGWVTVVGAGMIHRNVLKEFGYNPDEVTGFAFGFGTTRLTAQQFDLPRAKMLYENDLKVLRSL